MICKKLFTLCMIVLLALMIGCQKPQEENGVDEVVEVGGDEVIPDETEEVTPLPKVEPVTMPTPTLPPTPEPVAQPTPSPVTVPPVTAPAPSSDPKLTALMKKAKEKVKSYGFYYTTSQNWELWRDQYFVRGDNIKVKLYDVNLYNKENYFDTVYLNTRAKTGSAFCEHDSHVKCKDKDREFVVQYEDFVIKTPLEWLESMHNARWVGTETFDDRNTQVVEYDENGSTVRVWIDAFYGVPLKVIVYHGDIENAIAKYGFRDMTINTVTSSDMQHIYLN
jgi:hypothetical protein